MTLFVVVCPAFAALCCLIWDAECTVEAEVAVLQVVKVFHGSDRDILWLQRDFGNYVANMFDTGQAARVLSLQGHGLAFLLQSICGVEVRARDACSTFPQPHWMMACQSISTG